jgi:4-amino-4-deoxy-L-arabinose transferase-like glycosyltransferase
LKSKVKSQKSKVKGKVKRFLKEHIVALIVLLFSAVFFFLSIRTGLLDDWDECMYAGFARNMHDSAFFAANMWSDGLFLDKLPFYTYLLQIPLFFGSSEWLLRLPSFLFGLGVVWMIYWYGQTYFTRTVGVLAMLVFLVAPINSMFLTRMSTDPGFVFFILCSVFAYKKAVRKKDTRIALVSGIFLALAVLIKGLSIFPFIMAFLVISLLERAPLKILITTGLMSALMVLPVFGYLYTNFGEPFIRMYFLENLIQRGKYPIEFHFGGRLYYVKEVLREFGFWLLPLLVIAIRVTISLLKNQKGALLGRLSSLYDEYREDIHLLAILGFSFFFLTMAATKIAWYAMPMYPFLSLLIAQSLARMWRPHTYKIVSVIILLLVGQALFVLISQKHFFRDTNLTTRHQAYLAISKEKDAKFYYYVPFAERQAKAILSDPHLYTSMTWRYGGSPCAHYYSGKKVTPLYETKDFMRLLGAPRENLYLFENGDIKTLDGIKYKLIYQNPDYSVIRY